ncbi:MAG TPA: PhoPQ-activated protein PqaA family protein [Fimbriimonadaceae bacterium]|nr:PhoPQ-activated protein PqaA family protein [Fimbriimonadaceae bacterium]
MVFFHLALGLLEAQPLDAYLAKPDATYTFKAISASETSMVSQTWRGHKWSHTIRRSDPTRVTQNGVAILLITGDRVDRADLPYSEAIAKAAGLPVFTLFDIPNQPLWGKVEDDLIAHTFENFMKSGESDWPLLLPMTKAALRAMDTVTATTKNSKNPIRKFVVTGASKRGWTTWLVGASGNSRVIGIAPMVFDNLNFKAQLDHQRKLWGRLSPMLADYSERGLDQVLDTEPGRKLLAMVDPYAYKRRYGVPILNVVGTNDPYWAPDSHQLYRDLSGQVMLVVPNRGHNLGGDEIPGLAEFAKRVASGDKVPVLEAGFDGLKYSVSSGSRVSCWIAESETMDFTKSVWKATGSNYKGTLPPSKRNRAVFFKTANLTTGVTLIPRSK